MKNEEVNEDTVSELGIMASAEDEFKEKFADAFDAADAELDGVEDDGVVDDDDDEPDGDDADDDSDDVSDGESDDDDDAGESEDDDDKTKDDDVDIDPELMRAAEWAGMKEEAVDLYKTDKDKAMSMLRKIHAKQNALTAQYAEAGRQRLEAGRQQQQTATQTVTTTQAASKIDWDKTKKIYEDMGLEEEQIEAILAPQRAAIEAAEQRAQAAENAASEYAARQVRQAALQQVADFFVSDRLKPYTKLYGDKFDVNKISDKQRELIDKAVMIRAGYAATTGGELPLSDALEQAHSLVSSEYLAQAEREKLKGSVKKRRNGSTQKPTHGRKGGTIKDKLGMPQEFHEKFNKAFRNN
jgi:hypothetical protein